MRVLFDLYFIFFLSGFVSISVSLCLVVAQIVRETHNHQFINGFNLIICRINTLLSGTFLVYNVLTNDTLCGKINKRIERTHHHQNTI